MKVISEMTEIGDSVTRIDQLMEEAAAFSEACLPDFERADEVMNIGRAIIDNNDKSASKDTVEPKCNELYRITKMFNERLRKRNETLIKARDLMERVENANEWCAKGIDLLASQRIENVSVPPETAEIKLQEIIRFVESAEDFQLSSLRDFDEGTSLLNLEGIIVSQVRCNPLNLNYSLSHLAKHCRQASDKSQTERIIGFRKQCETKGV